MSAASIKVLLIEDNPGDARLIREMLQEAHGTPFDLDWVPCLADGLVRLARRSFDLVLLDLGLPDSAGVDTFRHVREQAPHVPVIVLTGLDDEVSATAAVRLGAQEYLVKGEAESSPLARSIRYAIERKHVEDDLQRAEERLRQAQKMEALGRLAGGVAHDFNNLLTSILGFSHLAADSLPADHPVRGDLQEVIYAGERAADLTRQLLAVGRRQIVQMRALDLNAVVTGMDNLLRRTLGEDVELVTVLGEDLQSVVADAGCLEQMILNLAVNAREAMPKGGKLLIATESVTHALAGDAAAVKRAQPCVKVTVRDTGCGIAADVKEHMFEPFFTTKAKGEGSGLGLSTVYGIVSQFGGEIECDSQVGNGAEFRIYFPGVDTPAVNAVMREMPPAQGGAETILVVEDEAAVRAFTVRVLTKLGYRVLEAENGEAALTLCGQVADPIDLVFTDVVMPLLGGPDLVERLRATRPAFRVLYATGFTQSSIVHEGAIGRGEPILLKPYTREALAQKVRDVLDQPLPG